MALHEQSVGATSEWFTPPYVFDAMGVRFDMDVAHPGAPHAQWVPADAYLTDGSLETEWRGFVWMNAPFGAATVSSLGSRNSSTTATASLFARIGLRRLGAVREKKDPVHRPRRQGRGIASARDDAASAWPIRVPGAAQSEDRRARLVVREGDMSFSYLSVCSGLEAATLAFEPLGATPVGFSEIEAFPSAIIAHRYGSNLPGEAPSRNAPPNFGDFTKIPLDTLGTVDVLIGGTPCQAFSVAGKRLSLADARGNLTVAFAVLAHELARSHGLRNVIWENVPGVLSAVDNAFGCFLGAIVGADDALRTPDGGSWPDAGMVAGPRARAAWRVLDAQYFGLAQRRRRVFVVADFGNGADPAAVLFEPKSLRGNSPPRREKGQGVAAPSAGSLTASGRGVERPGDSRGQDPIVAELIASTGNVAHCLNAGGMGRQDYESETLVAHTQRGISEYGDGKPCLRSAGGDNGGGSEVLVTHALRAEGFDASEDGTGRGTPIVPLAFTCKDYGNDATDDLAPTMRSMGFDGSHANGGGQLAVAFDLRGREGGAQFEGPHETANIRAASGGSSRSYVAERWAVRRLTPAECEKLQGVPVGYTAIPWRGKPAEECPDGPRYKALGNSWAVPVVFWIGRRLAAELAKREPPA